MGIVQAFRKAKGPQAQIDGIRSALLFEFSSTRWVLALLLERRRVLVENLKIP